jgi:hypothetical protein
MRHWEIEELLAAAVGMSEKEYEEFTSNGEDIDDLCIDHFCVGIEEFAKIAEALVLLTIPQKSAIRETISHVFAVKGELGYRAILKTKVDLEN